MEALEKIKAEVMQLSTVHQEALRNWLEDLIEDRLELKDDFKVEIDARKNILEGLDRLLLEMPATGPAHPCDLAKTIVENRE